MRQGSHPHGDPSLPNRTFVNSAASSPMSSDPTPSDLRHQAKQSSCKRLAIVASLTPCCVSEMPRPRPRNVADNERTDLARNPLPREPAAQSRAREDKNGATALFAWE
jgi:hypothetical protein